jgi:hypothetical protein
MAGNISGYRHPGDIDFRNASLITSAGQVINLSLMIEELSVYQDITSHYLECDIILQDSLDLFDIIPPNKEENIQGGFDGFEYFILSFKNKTDGSQGDSYENYNNYIFRLYSIDERYKFGESKEAIMLSGISSEYFMSNVHKISRSLGKTDKNTISNMIESIVGEFVYNNRIKDSYRHIRELTKFRLEKKVEYDKTSGSHKFVIPNLTADDTIDFLINEADSHDHIPLYFFYEDSNGFKLKNVSNLVQAESKGTWIYSPFNRKGASPKDDEGAKGDDPFKIVSYTVEKQINTMENILGGLFRQKTLHVDIHRKSFRETEYDYFNTKDKFNKLQKSFFYGDADGTPILSMTTTRSGHESSSNQPFTIEDHYPKKTPKFKAKSEAYNKIIFNTVLNVEIPGADHLNVGEVIDIIIPKTAGMESDKDSGGMDKYLSGKYMITKLRHKVTGGTTGSPYATVMEISKDTSLL